MSSDTWINYGYGVCLKGLEFNSVDRLEKMLSYAPKFRKEIHEWFETCEITEPTLDDYFDYDQDYYNGMAFLLKSVIEEAEHIDMTDCDDQNGNRYVIFQPLYPWDMRWRHRRITKKKIRKVIRKYLSIVTDSEFEIYFEEAENCG